MLVLNVVWVFCHADEKVLMCKRYKQPYLGLYNLLGGKVDSGEDGLSAAYRELEEESSITRADLTQDLFHLMDFAYYYNRHKSSTDVRVEVYVGKLDSPVVVSGDEKELQWIDVNENFFDITRFAGEANIAHIYEQIKLRLDFN